MNVHGHVALEDQREAFMPVPVEARVRARVFVETFPDWQAAIHTSGGNYADHGTTRPGFPPSESVIGEASGPPTSVDQDFVSSQSQTTLIVPASKGQCMNGGWRNFPQFKNQRQCVAYVKAARRFLAEEGPGF
jgi:hypothetical protein